MAKFKLLILILIGFVLGFIAGDARNWLHGAMMASYKSADQSVSLTYAYAEQDTLRQESDVLKKMAEPFWLGMSSEKAKQSLSEMDLFSFEKGSDGFAAGPVFLRVQDGKIVEIQAHCARLKSSGCTDEGAN